MGKTIKAMAASLLACCMLAGCGGSTYDVTDPANWKTFDTAEFTVSLPDKMADSKPKLPDDGMTLVSSYATDNEAFGVAKITFEENPGLKEINVETAMSKFSIGGKKLDPMPLDGTDACYVTYNQKATDEKGATGEFYIIESFWKGEKAMYSVSAICRAEESGTMHPTLIEWLKSFKLKE